VGMDTSLQGTLETVASSAMHPAGVVPVTRLTAALPAQPKESTFAITKPSLRLLAPTLAVPLQVGVIMAGQKMKEYARK